MSACLLTSLGCLGVLANLALMLVIAVKRPLVSWSQGLVFHQAVVDGGRAAILLPLGIYTTRTLWTWSKKSKVDPHPNFFNEYPH